MAISGRGGSIKDLGLVDLSTIKTAGWFAWSRYRCAIQCDLGILSPFVILAIVLFCRMKGNRTGVSRCLYQLHLGTIGCRNKTVGGEEAARSKLGWKSGHFRRLSVLFIRWSYAKVYFIAD